MHNTGVPYILQGKFDLQNTLARCISSYTRSDIDSTDFWVSETGYVIHLQRSMKQRTCLLRNRTSNFFLSFLLEGWAMKIAFVESYHSILQAQNVNTRAVTKTKRTTKPTERCDLVRDPWINGPIPVWRTWESCHMVWPTLFWYETTINRTRTFLHINNTCIYKHLYVHSVYLFILISVNLKTWEG